MTPRDAWIGRLTPTQASRGMHLALQNARALASDAGVLLEAENWPPAAALAILAIEEFVGC